MDLQYALTLVRQNGNRISMVPEHLRTEEIRKAAISRTPTAIVDISDPTVDEQKLAVKSQGEIDRDGIFDLLSMFTDVDPIVLDATLDVNGNCINLIKDPTDDQKFRAVTRDGDAIKHIEDPEHSLQVIAVQHDPKNVSLIDDPTYEVVDVLVTTNPRSIEFVKRPHRDHQEMVLRKLPDDGLHYLQHVDEDIALKYISENPEKIQLLQNQTEECCWAALTADGSYIKHIRNPTLEMESYAKLVSDGN